MEIKRTDDNGSAADFSSLFFKHALGKTAEAKALSGNPNWPTVSCYSPTFLYSVPLPPFLSHFASCCSFFFFSWAAHNIIFQG